MGRRRRGIGSDDKGLVLAGPPDWQTDPRWRWKARDWFAWALWAAQSPRDLLQADRLPRGRWSGRGPMGDPIVEQKILTAARWWDLRFEMALFAFVATGAPIRAVREDGWRVIPTDRRLEVTAQDKWVSYRSVNVFDVHSRPSMPTEQEALGATRRLRKFLEQLVSGREVRYSPAERIGRWEDESGGKRFLFRPVGASESPSKPGFWRTVITESFWALATQFAHEMAECNANRCDRRFLKERRGHRFCSDACEERERKRAARRLTRA